MIRYTIGEMYNNISYCQNFTPRDCLADIQNFCLGDLEKRIQIIYGLRRTGKTTLMFQAIEKLGIYKCVYLECEMYDDMSDIYEALDEIIEEEHDIKYIFIDEITSVNDYIGRSAILANKYSLSFKIVISGEDSLSHIFAKDNALYNKTRTVSTTYLPFYEYSRIFKDKDIDLYLKTGGLMHEKILDDDYPFINIKNTQKYADVAISKNILHSLEKYDDGKRFKELEQLYRNEELVKTINKVIALYSGSMDLLTLTAELEIDKLIKMDLVEELLNGFLNNRDNYFSQSDEEIYYDNIVRMLDQDEVFETEITQKMIVQITKYLEDLGLLHRSKINSIFNNCKIDIGYSERLYL